MYNFAASIKLNKSVKRKQVKEFMNRFSDCSNYKYIWFKHSVSVVAHKHVIEEIIKKMSKIMQIDDYIVAEIAD